MESGTLPREARRPDVVEVEEERGGAVRPSPPPNAPARVSEPKHVGPSAEERFRNAYDSIVWTGIIVSVVLHFLVFSLWPAITAPDMSVVADELVLAELPPEVEIPPPPDAIARPATPVVAADADISEDITIAPTTFEENPVEDLPPPPEETGGGDISETPTFTPYTVAPDLRNRQEASAAILREWPTMLRDAHIGGTVIVWFFIDESGKVVNTKVSESSGFAALDEAALRVADVFRFTPALNRDQPVKVWVEMPITFRMAD